MKMLKDLRNKKRKLSIFNQNFKHKNKILVFIFIGVPWNFTFNVKFYPPDPAQLTEDITR